MNLIQTQPARVLDTYIGARVKSESEVLGQIFVNSLASQPSRGFWSLNSLSPSEYCRCVSFSSELFVNFADKTRAWALKTNKGRLQVWWFMFPVDSNSCSSLLLPTPGRGSTLTTRKQGLYTELIVEVQPLQGNKAPPPPLFHRKCPAKVHCFPLCFVSHSFFSIIQSATKIELTFLVRPVLLLPP